MLTVESSHFTVREDGGISKGARLINFIKTFLTSISHAEYTYIPYVLVGGTVVISVVEGDGCTEEVIIRNVNVPYVSHYQYLRPVCLDFSTIHSYFSILYVILVFY